MGNQEEWKQVKTARALGCERATAEIMDFGIKGVSLLNQDKVSDNMLYEAILHWQKR